MYQLGASAPIEGHFDSAQRPSIVSVAKSQLGVRELTGKNDGAAVKMYLNSVGLDEGYAWCAAFVYWAHDQAGIKAVRSAWSPSWFPKDKLVKYAKPGDVFGIYFRSKKRIAHVGIIEVPGDVTITIEGNTNEAGSREGDGVYRKRRLAKQIYQTSRWN
jgi:uncharacterized protein (TIGR02594 family)